MVWFRPREGSFGFVLLGWWLHIKAPWNAPLFSERYGYHPPRWKAGGWRVWVRRVRHPDCP
jgi:hypothetical protein